MPADHFLFNLAFKDSPEQKEPWGRWVDPGCGELGEVWLEAWCSEDTLQSSLLRARRVLVVSAVILLGNPTNTWEPKDPADPCYHLVRNGCAHVVCARTYTRRPKITLGVIP